MMGPTSPVRPKTKVLMQCPGNLAAVGRTDCTLERPRLGVKSPVKSPVRTPSYRASTWTVHNAARMWLVHLKYRHLAGQYRLCTSTGTVHSIPYGQSRLIRAVCRISPQNSSTCSIAPLRTRPAQNLVYIGAGRAWQTEHCLSVRLPPPQKLIPDPPDPGLPIAVRSFVPSSQPRFEDLVRLLVRENSTTLISTSQ